MSEKYGKIAQVIGPVVDVIFEGDDNIIPPIYTALRVTNDKGAETILEVEQHIGEDTVRCVSMESTDGLRRGMRVDNLDRPIAVPTGDQVKGRLLNVLGDSIDRLAHTCTAEQTDLTTLAVRFEKVDDLDAGKEDFSTDGEVVKLGGGLMDGAEIVAVELGKTVD